CGGQSEDGLFSARLHSANAWGPAEERSAAESGRAGGRSALPRRPGQSAGCSENTIAAYQDPARDRTPSSGRRTARSPDQAALGTSTGIAGPHYRDSHLANSSVHSNRPSATSSRTKPSPAFKTSLHA